MIANGDQVFGKRKRGDCQAEIQAHLDAEADELRAQGLSEAVRVDPVTALRCE